MSQTSAASRGSQRQRSPLEVEVRGPGAEPGSGVETAPGRERPADEAGGGTVAGQGDAPGYFYRTSFWGPLGDEYSLSTIGPNSAGQVRLTLLIRCIAI